MFKPIAVILIAVAIASGAAFYLSKQSAQSPDSAGPPSTIPATQGIRIRGPQNAAITLVEFGDYQCPSCGYFAPIVEEVLRRFPKDVKLEFHHFPLISIHQHAMPAALAAEAAADQGKFWEMHDLLYQHQDAWSRAPSPEIAESAFLSYASQLGMDANKFMQSMRSPSVKQRVLEDVVKAREANIDETPTFFINGQKVITKPKTPDEFSKLIEAALPKK